MLRGRGWWGGAFWGRLLFSGWGVCMWIWCIYGVLGLSMRVSGVWSLRETKSGVGWEELTWYTQCFEYLFIHCQYIHLSILSASFLLAHLGEFNKNSMLAGQ